MNNKSKAILEIYNLGYSTQNVADTFNEKKNTIIKLLQYHGVLRQAPGVNIEKKVYNWLKKHGYNVTRMKGDHPYDLKINNLRVDVKSSNKNKNGKYYFELQHKQSKPKNLHQTVDFYILVYDNKYMHKVKSNYFKPYQKNTRVRREQLEFIGELN